MPCSSEGWPPSPVVQPGSVECEERIKELEKKLKTTDKKNRKLEHELYVLKEAFKVMGATG